MDITFTGVVSIRSVTHNQVLEKMRLFAELVGRSPKLTVCPLNRVNFYVVHEVLPDGLVIALRNHDRTIIAPIDGVYRAVSLF